MVKDLAGRTLSFDSYAGYLCAELHAKAHSAGCNMGLEDMMIAAIAQANNCAVATRNVKDYEQLGVKTFNPFEYEPPASKRTDGRT